MLNRATTCRVSVCLLGVIVAAFALLGIALVDPGGVASALAGCSEAKAPWRLRRGGGAERSISQGRPTWQGSGPTAGSWSSEAPVLRGIEHACGAARLTEGPCQSTTIAPRRARRRGFVGTERDEGEDLDQAPPAVVRAVVAKAGQAREHGTHDGHEHAVAALVVGEDAGGLLGRQRSDRRPEAPPSDLDLHGASGEHVAIPLAPPPEPRHHHRLGALGPPADDLHDRLVEATGAAPAVGQQQEPVAQQPSAAGAVQAGRQREQPLEHGTGSRRHGTGTLRAARPRGRGIRRRVAHAAEISASPLSGS